MKTALIAGGVSAGVFLLGAFIIATLDNYQVGWRRIGIEPRTPPTTGGAS